MYTFETKLIKAGKNRDGKDRYNIYLTREAIIKLTAQPKMPVRVIIEPIIEKDGKTEQNETKAENDPKRVDTETDSSTKDRPEFRDNQKTEQLPHLPTENNMY